MRATYPSPFAGTWYPEHPEELETQLAGLFARSAARTGEVLLPRPVALVAPHAGFEYSGTVAAAAYRSLQVAGPSRVVILGFLHNGRGEGVFAPDVGEYRTPLGRLAVDLGGNPFPAVEVHHASDHSLELQLPFVQFAIPGVPVAPLYVSSMGTTDRRDAAEKLARMLRQGDILLASTDLTHYGRSMGYVPFPMDADTPGRLWELDDSILEGAGSLDAAYFLEAIRRYRSTMCGTNPVALLLETLSLLDGPEIFQQTLDYQTSGDLTGDYELSVSYGALGYFHADAFGVGEPAQQALLRSARETLRHAALTGTEEPRFPGEPMEEVRRNAPVFVSLHKNGELIGCTGRIGYDLPLWEGVPRLTLDSLHDPRFPHARTVPADADIEISILTPRKRIPSGERFRVGEHGALLRCRGRSGLLLPQVAEDFRCDGAGFLRLLARKAGLAEGALQDPHAALYVFRAQVFGERGQAKDALAPGECGSLWN